MIERTDIINEARSWVGTPYHHQGRLKGIGCDCVGLVIGVAQRFGISQFDTSDYGRIPDPVRMKALLDEHLDVVPVDDHQPGDIGWIRFVKDPQHLVIFSDCGIIHSYANARKCVEHGFDTEWKRRLVAVYRYRGVAPWQA